MKAILLSPYLPLERREIPLMLASVQAGFPSPADDYTEEIIDINDLFQVDSSTSFFVRASGESMVESGVWDGDILCVRKDLNPKDGNIVIATIDGENTVKYFHEEKGRIIFKAANQNYPDIIPGNDQDVMIWGVVTGIFRSTLNKR